MVRETQQVTIAGSAPEQALVTYSTPERAEEFETEWRAGAPPAIRDVPIQGVPKGKAIQGVSKGKDKTLEGAAPKGKGKGKANALDDQQ